ncbi:MAG: radical SAM protein [Chthoniobacteraceae bacterium]
MPEIVLATLNAKYIHAAFGLRYLLANLGELRGRATIAEFDINQRPIEIVERLLAHEPRIIGLGVYIWNVVPTTEVVALIKRVRPDVRIVLGGPEVSYECDEQEIVRLADHTITGEADLKFAEVCRALLESGERNAESGEIDGVRVADLSRFRSPLSALPKIIPAELPQPAQLALPYELYTDDDIAHRVLYVEASRGCPFTCEFCLSSLDIPVRAFALDAFLAALDGLLARGARQFKFVDRTFNLHLPTARAILGIFLERWRDGLFVHFEMVPDRLPPELRELIAQFPPGALQFEVGIQTFDDATSKNISRRQNLARLDDNLRYLRAETGVHVHADLIVGLPGEDLASFGRGFDRLVALAPQEIQVGILKRLRGTPIVRHDAEFAMIYSPEPPYEILQTRDIDFAAMQRMRRFARYWDLVANSGRFARALPLLWRDASPFERFLRFSDWLHARLRRTHEIALNTLAESLSVFLTDELGIGEADAAAALAGTRERSPGESRQRLRRQARHTAGSV